jgi:ATP-dependent DNA helicase PIF1
MKSKSDLNENTATVTTTNTTHRFVNKLLNNMQCTLAKSNLSQISPLNEIEINSAMRARQAKQNKLNNGTPVRALEKTNNTQNINPSRNVLKRSNSEAFFNTPSKPVVPKPANKLSRYSSASGLKQLQQTSSSYQKPLVETNHDNDLFIQLTYEQKDVLNVVKAKHNLFFTGSGGSGKSFLLRIIRKCLPHNSTFVTASTGVAASLISGITLHAFSGIIVDKDDNNDIEMDEEMVKKKNERIVERILQSKEHLNNWKKCQHLIIDEISMIPADLFEKLDLVAK